MIIVDFLLANGADVSWKNIDKETALSLAVWERHTVVVQLLLDDDAEVDSESIDGQTQLQLATEWHHETLVQLRLNYGADANRPNSTLPSEPIWKSIF